ncbi:MAG TPA: DUF2892 domain-containing protein [Thiotrichaceae bacterium]|jgi:quinol-cytochrome oxidoreductase complex cytochrome b subunit|nr:DUF2892 domain-containing protein [Thiotrichaceae bacterium]HIM08072.1 DUF2892 domain-containing protein [Gammaproteobacteria bacterium]
MNKNVGKIDRTIRIIAGASMLGAGYYFQSWWGLIGLVPMGTATFGYCPPYALLGINTCGIDSEEATAAEEP